MAIPCERFIHPEDKAALEKLKAVPLLELVVKKVDKHLIADSQHAVNLASRIRIGPKQLPEIFRILEDVCQILQIPVPELYVAHGLDRVSYTSGDARPFVVVDAEMLERLSPVERKILLAHACGHILCGHSRYTMLANAILELDGGLKKSAVITGPLKWAAAYWMRNSEFSADRVAAFVMQDADCVARAIMRLSFRCVSLTDDVRMDEFLKQSEEFDKISSEDSDLENWWDLKDLISPYPVVRAAEVVKWFQQSDVAASEPAAPRPIDNSDGIGKGLFEMVKLRLGANRR